VVRSLHCRAERNAFMDQTLKRMQSMVMELHATCFVVVQQVESTVEGIGNKMSTRYEKRQ